MEKPFVHPFMTPNGYYIYDVNADMILNIPANVYSYLTTGEKNGDASPDIDRYLQRMKSDGFLSSKRVEEMSHPDNEVLPYYIKRKMHMIILQVTQNCNLRCEYCVYSGNYQNRSHTDKSMRFATAKKGIDFLIGHSVDNELLHVGFYGGEPLLKFDLVKQCVEYAEKAAEGKEIRFNLTSNGTLLSGEITEYLARHKISLLLSLDGPREVQDKHRKFAGSGCGSFDTLYGKIEMLRKDFPEYYKESVSYNMVLDPSNDFGCINEFVCHDELFDDRYLSSSIIDEVYTDRKNNVEEQFTEKYLYEKFKMYLYHFNRLREECVSPLVKKEYEDVLRHREGRRRTQKGGLPETAHHSGPCIPGRQRLFMDVDGNFFPCERVSELSDIMKIGNVDDGIDLTKAKYLMNIGSITAEQCKECWAFRDCTICAKAVDGLQDISAELAQKKCPYVRHQIDNIFRDYCMYQEFGFDLYSD